MSPQSRRCLVVLVSLFVAACGSRGGNDDPLAPDAGPDDVENVEFCPNPVAPPTSGICDVTSGSGTAVLVRGTVLGNGTTYHDGSVLYEGERIICVGCDCSSEPSFAEATKVECANAVISPGLINPHDHITFTEGAPIDHGATRYEHRHDWRGSLSTPSNPHGTGSTGSGTRWGELRMLFSGVTSLVGSGRAENLVRNIDRLTPAEEAQGFEELEFQTFSLGDANETFRADCGWNYKFTEIEASEFSAYLPHVAEGINNYAAEEFRCQSTSFDGGQDITEKNVAQIHSIGLSTEDYLRMANDDTKLIWSPRSNISLYGHTAQVTTFDRFGGTIALGTDWTYSGSANILRELACADDYNRDYLDGHFSDSDLWRMVTINAAAATGTETLIGSLEAGKVADIAIFAADEGERHRAVLTAANSDVALVVLAGDPLFGETDTMSSLGKSCDPIDVCGSQRTVCATQEFGTSFDAIKGIVSEGKAAYPALFCGTPANEPTCVPSAGAFTGALTATDSDGDGIDNASDNCPTMFNPIRPIDNGVQPDADADGFGDPCDDTPLLDDLDGDGVPNSIDNCPFDSNDQLDGDSDNKGDICDFCPASPNPTSVCPAAPATEVTIEDIQTGGVTEGTLVTITDAVVVGVSDRGAWVQMPGVQMHGGIQVFVGSDPGVQVGDLVDATGKYVEYFDDTELTDATLTKKGTATPITPIELSAADAVTEPYEGMLVHVTGIDMGTLVDPFDCGCSDMNLWQVNGSLIVYDRIYQDADWASHVGADDLTGVMMTRYDGRRLMPRTADDFQ